MTKLEKVPICFKKKFKLQTCKDSSETKKELDEKHSPDEKKLFKCNSCKFSTTRKTYLNQNDNKCENCQTSFVQKRDLKTQKLTVHENNVKFAKKVLEGKIL